jgi:hypothetical protein
MEVDLSEDIEVQIADNVDETDLTHDVLAAVPMAAATRPGSDWKKSNKMTPNLRPLRCWSQGRIIWFIPVTLFVRSPTAKS